MRTIPIAIICSVFCLPGCATLVKTSAMAVRAPVKAISAVGRQKRVSQILCLWEAAEGTGLDGKPARGFAGQIIFSGYGQESPIKVNGKVRIFEYTNYDPDEPDPVPAHLFEFSDGGWNAHLHEGTLGYTYNVFLPYVEQNTGHAVCALRVEYETEAGRVTSSPFTQVTLARKSSKRPASAVYRNIVHSESNREHLRELARKNGEDKPEAATNAPEKLESTTIKLPRRKR